MLNLSHLLKFIFILTEDTCLTKQEGIVKRCQAALKKMRYNLQSLKTVHNC